RVGRSESGHYVIFLGTENRAGIEYVRTGRATFLRATAKKKCHEAKLPTPSFRDYRCPAICLASIARRRRTVIWRRSCGNVRTSPRRRGNAEWLRISWRDAPCNKADLIASAIDRANTLSFSINSEPFPCFAIRS